VRPRRLALALAALLAAAALPSLRPAACERAPAATEATGRVGGDFSVTPNGAASYAVPIEVPPGTAGVAPDLSLAYDSQAPNGILGVGWTLRGLSAISRCAATVAVDGYVGSIGFDRQDRFCLDGVRLILVEGAAYGAPGTVYHTAQETWTKIVAGPACGSGPCSFTAFNKDGTTLELGTTENSRVPIPGRAEIFAWSIRRSIDLNHDTVEVEYLQDRAEGTSYPQTVRYTGNTATGLAAQRSVVFGWEARDDVAPKYVGGFRTVQGLRLASLTTAVSGATVLQYRLTYERSGGTRRSLLRQIDQCAPDPQRPGSWVCLRPTVFDWQRESNALVSPNADANGRLIGGWCPQDGSHRAGWADFDGDGRVDLTCASDDGRQYVLLSTGTGLVSPNGDRDGLILTSWCGSPGAWAGWGDFNADGKADLHCDDADGNHWVMVSDGRGVASPDPSRSPVGLVRSGWCPSSIGRSSWINFNGEGRADLTCAAEDGSHYVLLSTGSGLVSPNEHRDGLVVTHWCAGPEAFSYWGDFNGDGMSDLSCSRRDGSQFVLLSTGHGVRSPNVRSDGRVLESWCAGPGQSFSTTDFNGDGLFDFSCHADDGSQYVMLSTGRELASPNGHRDGLLVAGWCGLPDRFATWQDFNGDALADLQCSDRQNGDEWVLLSTGTGLVPPGADPASSRIRSGWCVGAPTQRIDFNGDALGDLHCAGADGTQWALVHAAPFPDLVHRIINGLGGTVDVVHRPLTDGAVYRRAAQPSRFPILDVQSPLYAVASYALGDGRGASYGFRHFYTGAKSDLERRTWLGFATMTLTEDAGGRSTVTTYSQDFPAQGFVLETVARDRLGTVLGVSRYTPAVSSPYPQVQQVVPLQRIETTYQGGSPAFTLELRFQYDDYGNLELTSDLGDPAAPADDVFTCVRYDNDPAAWQLGYERQRQIARSRASCQAFLDAAVPVWNPEQSLRWTQLDYDARRNPETLRAYDDSTSGWLTFGRRYDDYGNVTAIDDPGGERSTLTWDATYRSFLVSRRSPPLANGLVLTSLYSYEPRFGVLVSATDPNGNERAWITDPFGRVVETRGPPPDGSRGASVVLSRTAFVAEGGTFYDETRQRQTWSGDDPAGWLWSRTYLDGLGRVYRTASRGPAAGRDRLQSFLYDAEGRPWKSSYPYFTGGTPEYVVTDYDEYGWPALTTYPDGSRVKTEYLLARRQVTSIEGYGTPDVRTTVATLNSRGDVVALLAANGGTTTSEYTLLSQRWQQTSPIGAVTTWKYDSLGRLRMVSDPDSGGRTYGYDPRGLLESAVDGAGNRVENRYDEIGRIVHRTVTPAAGGSEVTLYTYDQPQYANGLGNLTRVETAAALHEYGYDRYGRHAAESLTLDGARYTQQYGYDPAGRQATLTYPDGAVLHTGYDLQGFLHTLELEPAGGGNRKRYATYSGYDALGQPGDAAFGNGLVSKYDYYPLARALGRLRSVTLSRGATSVWSRTFGWNLFGQVLSITASPQPELSESFTYDNMGWLASAQGPYPAATYRYDRAGNLEGLHGATFLYPPGSNRLSGASDGLYLGYDGNGNTTSRRLGTATTLYRYDGSSNLVQILAGDGSSPARATLAAIYDYEGNRLRRVDAAGVVSRYITADYDMVEEGPSKRYTKYLRGPEGPVAAVTVEGGGPRAAQELRYRSERLAAGLYDPATPAGWLARREAGLRALAHHPRLAERLPLGMAALLLGLLLALPRGLARRETGYARRHRFFARLAPWVLAALVLGLAPPAAADLGPGNGYPRPGELYFVQDQVGSTALVTDARGEPLTQVVYQPYGGVDGPRSAGPDDFRPKLTGKERDDGTGLYYFGARYQDPSLGRFLQPDPARQFASPYVYVGNDPASAIDPDGRFAFVIAAIVIGAVAGAYFGGAAVNHTYNPARWDWKAATTYAGIFAGAAIGAAGGALGAVAAQAGVAVSIAGEILIGAGENAFFTALGGGSAKEIGLSALQGGAFGGLLGGAGRALSTGISRGAGRLLGRGDVLAERGGAGGGALSDLAAAAGGAARAIDGGCSSFPAGTLVATAEGPRPIEQVKAGERVWSADPAGGAPRLNAVSRLLRRTAERLVRVETDGAALEATEEHPFFVAGRGWVEAARLAPGDRLTRRSGGPLTVRAVAVAGSPEEVFNLEIERDRNYFVSLDEALVHNPICRWVPTIRKGFAEFWNNLSYKEFMSFWQQDRSFRQTIKTRLRDPGGMHEWLLVSRADKAKQWGVSYEHFSKWLRTSTEDVVFVDKSSPGGKGPHETNSISIRAHQEIDQLIDQAEDLNHFKDLVRDWANGELPGYRYAVLRGSFALPRGFQ
jgi:RHS repeat-associated protein